MSAVLQRPSGAAQSPSVGTSIVREFFPAAVMIAGGKKLSAFYSRVNTDARGVIGAGIFLPEERLPRCNIVGPATVTGDFRDPVIVAEYRVVPHELRGDLKIEWSGDDLEPSTPTAVTEIQLRSRTHRKGVFKRTLRVRVTDADGEVATATRTINLNLVDELLVPPNTGHTREPR